MTLDLHRFHAAADAPGSDDGHFADEADLGVAWRHSIGLGVSGGVFRVDPTAALRAIGGPRDRLLVTYFALDATF